MWNSMKTMSIEYTNPNRHNVYQMLLWFYMSICITFICLSLTRIKWEVYRSFLCVVAWSKFRFHNSFSIFGLSKPTPTMEALEWGRIIKSSTQNYRLLKMGSNPISTCPSFTPASGNRCRVSKKWCFFFLKDF